MNDKVKLIAFHLPQFHTFPENDEWWGKGFTEWTNTKKAVKLYPEHNQPREPFNDNYYDLSDVNNMIWQMKLAKDYGVYGFCYYHYWFKDGKLLLHKPLEAIRNYQGEKLPYCLCWANEPWTRAWEGNTKKVLMPQEYGGKTEWEEHFNYLLTFFEDDAYIKVNNKPMFVLYRTNNIPNCNDMIAYWNDRCIECGYNGIHVIEEVNCFQEAPICNKSSAYLEFEPLYTMTLDASIKDKLLFKKDSLIFNKKNGTNNQIYSYDYLWKKILSRNHKFKNQKKCYLGAFVDWDNTARKGKNGRIVIGTTPEKFENYLSEQVLNAIAIDSEFIFINAWNEWGEGTYLEPDKNTEYGYIEAVKKIFSK